MSWYDEQQREPNESDISAAWVYIARSIEHTKEMSIDEAEQRVRFRCGRKNHGFMTSDISIDFTLNGMSINRTTEISYREFLERAQAAGVTFDTRKSPAEELREDPAARRPGLRRVGVEKDIFQQITDGRRHYLIVENPVFSFEAGDIVTLFAFDKGKPIGKTFLAYVTTADDEKTSDAIKEEFCVIGFVDAYDAEALGWVSLEVFEDE